MNDVAERFYQRNFERLGFESRPEDFARYMADTRVGGQRYSRALAYLESHGGLDVLDWDAAIPRCRARSPRLPDRIP